MKFNHIPKVGDLYAVKSPMMPVISSGWRQYSVGDKLIVDRLYNLGELGLIVSVIDTSGYPSSFTIKEFSPRVTLI